MMFERQSDAKRFIVERILEQAEMEGVSLSEAERHMLSWSESDPGFKPDYKLAEALGNEIGDEEFEAKIASLIRRVFERDVATHSDATYLYREARAKLSEGDHYILVMLDRALGLRLRKWWPF
jgi:hypothetical protein